ncbi:Sec-independent protein translocase protein TatB [Aquisalinus flavus]|uniref:Sec-independent protein translocase protein TatB n=1 Tax=Aquisalinus flavus TaxID=1526572 RepID=A0A8J2Y5M8_9PROT|nr:Sec-independent protein translocase protein TatB [Aquisalinus flavus]MBD0427273.1 twin-arginine translocase subunit TatB [Aquisalinus flavus]UNE47085.1 twin-arginine translocase subunit TatB [Aquisalinus flavus]GGC99691.1 hypothetical protein GCM10011342_05880 [Aquisalinus flavus]
MSLLPQIGFLELMVLAVLALVVVGPKDLPKLMRGIGKFLKQARAMADEFRAGFDEMARETEMAELREEIESLKKNNPVNEVKKAVEDTARQADADRYQQVKGTPPKQAGETKAAQAAEQSDAPVAASEPAETKKAEGGA